LVLVPVEEVLDLPDADDVHRGLGQALVEEALDAPVGRCAGRNVHQAEVPLRVQTPHGRVPGGELLQGVHAEVILGRIADRLAQDSCPGRKVEGREGIAETLSDFTAHPTITLSQVKVSEFFRYRLHRATRNRDPEKKRYRLQVRPHGVGRAVEGSAADAAVEPRVDVGLDHVGEVHPVNSRADMEETLGLLQAHLQQQRGGHVLRRGGERRLERYKGGGATRWREQ